MGVESANFVFKSISSPDSVGSVIESLGGRSVESKSNFTEYALTGSEYWIDVQLIDHETNGCDVSIRLALCNPPAAFDQLIKIIQALFEKCSGAFVIRGNEQEIQEWSSTASQAVRNSLEEQRENFINYFGPDVYAVSASDVFKHF